MQCRHRKVDDASVQDHLHRFRRGISLAPTARAGIKPVRADSIFMRYAKHNVLVHNPHPQSLAALVLLTKKLAPREFHYTVWLRYRKWFLKQHLKKHKKLTCFYCGAGPLKKQSDFEKDLATLDHVKPLSKGGERFCSSNLVVACYSCNSRKRDKDLNEFINPIV